MSLAPIVSALSDQIGAWPVSVAIASSAWLFPLIETFHVFGLTALLASIALVDLRLMGLTGVNRPVTVFCDEALPWTWGAFALAAVTGVLMFISQPSQYVANPAFLSKLVLILLASLNMLVFQVAVFGGVSRWDLSTAPPRAARAAGALSLLLWIGVIACGRWIAFVH